MMKKKKFINEKFKSIISFLFVCALLLSLIAICFAIKRDKESSFEVVGASADSISTDYPSANLFDFSILKDKTSNSSGFIYENYSFYLNDNRYSPVFFNDLLLKDILPTAEAGEYYTFSCYIASNVNIDLIPSNAQLAVVLSANFKEIIPRHLKGFVSRTVLLDEQDLNSRVWFYGGTDIFDYCIWSNFTCNKGQVAYPFQPNYNDFINQGFEEGKAEGFEEGKTEGLEEGKMEGLQASKRGIWNNLSGYSVKLYDFELSSNVSLPDSIVLNELDLIPVSNLIEGSTVNLNRLTPFVNNYFQSNYNLHVENFDNVKIDISFLFSPNVNLNDVGIIGDGASENYWDDVSFITSDNRSFLGSWEYYDGDYFLVKPTVYTSPLLQKLTFYTAGSFGINLLDMYLSDGNKNWFDGFNAGKSESNSISYSDGFKEGEIIGYKEGYNNGLIQGSTDPYSLGDFMFTYLDMPGRIIYNFLNFDFLGYNVASLFALLITALIVAYVWKKVT